MRIVKTASGNLKMTCSTPAECRAVVRNGRHARQTSKAEAAFVRRVLSPLGYRQVAPEDIGALTDATIITDGADYWGDMDYQVRSMLEVLSSGGTVTWTKG